MDNIMYAPIGLILIGLLIGLIKYYNHNEIKRDEITHGEFVIYSNKPTILNTLTEKRNLKEIQKLIEERIAYNDKNKRYKVTYIKRFKESNLTFFYTLNSIEDLNEVTFKKVKQQNI